MVESDSNWGSDMFVHYGGRRGEIRFEATLLKETAGDLFAVRHNPLTFDLIQLQPALHHSFKLPVLRFKLGRQLAQLSIVTTDVVDRIL